ncbi:MAG: hypothetical protein JSR98_21995 [Proteobacteria bacterium]|nr:hypothetical protein [Pseudomonadota bacterium]
MRLYAKAGASGADVAAAQTDCKAEAEKAHGPTVRITVVNSKGVVTPTTAAAGPITGAFIQAYLDAPIHRAAMRACMRRHGFALLDLTEAENADYRALKDDKARAAWEAGFLSRATAEQVAAGLTPKATPFPLATDDPFTVGGARLDASSLKLAAGPVKKGPLVTADGFHRRLVRVKDETSLGQWHSFYKSMIAVVPAGTVFYQVYIGRPAGAEGDDDLTVWCGEMAMKGKPWFGCLQATFDGYKVQPLFDVPHWLVGQPPYGIIVYDRPLAASLVLEDLPPETSPAFEISLNVEGVSKKGARLAAYAMKDNQQMLIWHGFVPFDATGHGELPFWTQTLALTYSDAGVTAEFKPRADGQGWYDLPDST